MIRISLVIPTHNRAAQLVAALESVVRQDLPRDEWECVVVSNNSTDDTEARFAAFAAAHPGCGLRLVAEEGPGVSYARNRGLREAQAPLVAFIDDDERVNEGFLRAYLEFFETRPGAVVAGGRIVAEYPAGRPAWMSKYVEMPIANPMDLDVRRGCRNTSKCRSPIRWISESGCVRSRRDAFPGAAIWLSAVRGWPVTGGSIRRWGA